MSPIQLVYLRSLKAGVLVAESSVSRQTITNVRKGLPVKTTTKELLLVTAERLLGVKIPRDIKPRKQAQEESAPRVKRPCQRSFRRRHVSEATFRTLATMSMSEAQRISGVSRDVLSFVRDGWAPTARVAAILDNYFGGAK